MAGRAKCDQTWADRVAEKQADKYALALASGAVARRRDRDAARQAAGYRREARAQVRLLTAARQVLMAAGVPTIEFVSYYNFVRFLSRMRAELPKPGLPAVVDAAITRWEAAGLNPAVLARIGREVLGVGPVGRAGAGGV